MVFDRLLQELAAAHSSREAKAILARYRDRLRRAPKEARDELYRAATDIISELPAD